MGSLEANGRDPWVERHGSIDERSSGSTGSAGLRGRPAVVLAAGNRERRYEFFHLFGRAIRAFHPDGLVEDDALKAVAAAAATIFKDRHAPIIAPLPGGFGLVRLCPPARRRLPDESTSEKEDISYIGFKRVVYRMRASRAIEPVTDRKVRAVARAVWRKYGSGWDELTVFLTIAA